MGSRSWMPVSVFRGNLDDEAGGLFGGRVCCYRRLGVEAFLGAFGDSMSASHRISLVPQILRQLHLHLEGCLVRHRI